MTAVAAEESVVIPLSREDLQSLSAVVHHYEDVTGFFRHVVVATSKQKIKRRYRYIVHESNALEALVEDLIHRMGSAQELQAQMPLQDLVAFWGRLLSSLKTKRTRRRISSEEAALRERLTVRFSDVVCCLWLERSEVVRRAIDTRRRREVEWMMQAIEDVQRANT